MSCFLICIKCSSFVHFVPRSKSQIAKIIRSMIIRNHFNMFASDRCQINVDLRVLLSKMGWLGNFQIQIFYTPVFP